MQFYERENYELKRYSNTFSIFENDPAQLSLHETMLNALQKSAIVPVISLLILLPACRDEVICTEDVVSRAGAGFYVRDGEEKRDTVLNNLTFYGVLRPDSLLYDSSGGIRQIVFPLSRGEGEYTGFVLMLGSLSDTLRIHHSSRLELVSFSCGFTVIHDIEGVSFGNTIIDTISISDPLVDLTDDENLEIYIRPAVVDSVG